MIYNNDIAIEVIATGSSGNAILIENKILFDCGVPFSKIKPYYKDIQLVFVSHCHQDHLNKSTIKKIFELRPNIRFCILPYLVEPLLECGINKKNIDVMLYDLEHVYKGFSITPFILKHDVPNSGVRLFINNKKLIFATDTCSLEHIEAKDYDYYLIESNYVDSELEERIKKKRENGEFIYENRVRKTHLSDEACNEWLMQNMGDNSQYIKLHQHVDR